MQSFLGSQADPPDTGVRETQGNTESYSFWEKVIFPYAPQLAPPFLCRTFPPHGKILIYFSLKKSTGLTLATPETLPHIKGHRSQVDGS